MEGYDSILLVQHRYHTNQHPVVKTLTQKGHEVHFLSVQQRETETYDVLSPDLIKKSAVFSIIASIVATAGLGTLREKYAWPASFWYLAYLRRTDPDLIILKKYYPKSISTIILARLLGIEVLFYDQTPVYGDGESYTKRKVASIVYYVLFWEPFVRFSPVKGDTTKRKATPRAYYLPFCIDRIVDPEDRTYVENGVYRLITVATYTQRKNQLDVLESVETLREQYDIKLTFIGHLPTHSDAYYQRLTDYVSRNEMEDIVQLKTNLEYDEVQQEYCAHDIFILPSEREAAAVSPIEAMGAGLSIVSSHDNGTRWSIKPTENGYIFQCGNVGVLTDLLDNIIQSPERVESFGLRSIELAEKNHSSDAFYATLSTIVTDHLSG